MSINLIGDQGFIWYVLCNQSFEVTGISNFKEFSFSRLGYVHHQAHQYSLGTGKVNRSDEFSEKFRKGGGSFSIQKFILQNLDL